MVLYTEACTVVITDAELSQHHFEVKVDLHQGSVLSQLLFSVVMVVISSEARSGLPYELLYADELVLMAPIMEQLGRHVVELRVSLFDKEMKVNAGKSKVMFSSSGEKTIVNSEKWSCSVCGIGVQANSIKYTVCTKWIHKRCSGVRGDLSLVVYGFRWKRCDGTIQNADPAEDLVVYGETYRCVKRFCYLGDTLDGDGGAHHAATAIIRNGWMNSRECLPFLTSRASPLEMKGRVYANCVRSSMIYRRDTMPLLADAGLNFERAEMQVIRWMCGVSMKDRKTSEELRKLVGVEPITTVIRRGMLIWYGHVMSKKYEDWVKKCMEFRV